MPDYLQDTAVGGVEVNFADRGIQLTRAARALKLWLSLQYFGVDAFREAIDRSLDLAVLAQERIEASEELELLSPATLGIVCFRRRPAGVDDEPELEALNTDLVRRFAESGEGLISSTRIDGSYAHADVHPEPPHPGRGRRAHARLARVRAADAEPAVRSRVLAPVARASYIRVPYPSRLRRKAYSRENARNMRVCADSARGGVTERA